MKIGIVGPIHEKGMKILQNEKFDIVEVNDVESSNLQKELQDVDGIVLRTAHLSNDVLENCPNLKIVSRHGVGYDNVDINFLSQRKIALAVTGTANAISVAEHVMAFFLHLSKNINLSDSLTRKGQFEEKSRLPDFYELYQKNVLIFGFGRIGQAVAKRCHGFEMNVYVFDPFVEEKFIRSMGCLQISKDEGLQISDYILSLIHI